MSDERSIYVANFHEDVGEDLLEELFTQVGPVVKVMVRDVRDSNAKFALIEFEDEASVLFSIETMDGVKLYGVPIQVKPRNGSNQETLYRQKRSEIMDRQRSTPTAQSNQDYGGGRRSYDNRDRDRERDRDWDRDRDRSRSGSQRDYHRRDRDPLPPPPPPPGGSWRNDRGYSTPQMLPHQQFIQHMMQHHSAPSNYQPRHFQPPPPPPPQQFQTPHRGQDRRGYDRQGYSGRNGGGRY